MDVDVSDSDVYERLMGGALRFVSYRPRSGKEIREFLEKKLERSHTSAPLVIGRVLERLTELGYLDDHKFTTWWVEQRTGRRPKGARLIEEELRTKGVDRQIIADTITHLMKDDRSEIELARVYAKKKLTMLSGRESREQRRRLSEFLSRRGFSSTTVWRVVDEVTGKE